VDRREASRGDVHEEVHNYSALIVAFVTPALAADYYVALRLGGGGCTIMTHSPSPTKYKMMGHFSSRSAAKKAMATMTECK
jgi:hypothetical protein